VEVIFEISQPCAIFKQATIPLITVIHISFGEFGTVRMGECS
jgi:hypothetical protein